MGINTLKYIMANTHIVDKDGELVKLKPNTAQEKLYAVIAGEWKKRKPVRIIVLKSRQVGLTTMTAAIYDKLCTTRKNRKAFIIAQDEQSTAGIFEKYKKIHQHKPAPWKPETKASNAKEIVFDNDNGTGLNSQIRCFTAGANAPARGTTCHYLHITELAFWPENKKVETLLGIMQSVPSAPETMIIIESTANGFDEFRTRWYAAVNGESEFIPVFVAWWEMEEYRRKWDGTPLSDKENELKETYGLDNDQIQWRRWCISTNCGGDERLFRQEYPATPDEAFLTTGRTYFDNQVIVERIKKAEKLIYPKGEFTFKMLGEKIVDPTIKFVRGRQIIKIFKQPEKGERYVIGGDTAGEGSDFCTAQVISQRTGEQVAVLKAKMDEDMYAQQVYCLGRYYNNAFVAIENNFSLYPNNYLYKTLGYKQVFFELKEDSVTKRMKPILGFRTSVQTRTPMLSNLSVVVREFIETINDVKTLREMLTFVVDNSGRAAAMNGNHDDLIMALAIAHYKRADAPRASVVVL